MMTKNRSKTKTFLKQLTVIPLFICFILIFSTKIIAQNKGVSKALIKEYESKIQKSNGSVIIKNEDAKRIRHIYNLMSKEQKAKVTKIPTPKPSLISPSAPTLPTSPAVPAVPELEIDYEVVPPPVPEPIDVEEVPEINEVTSPSATSAKPTDYIIEMAKKGATFYFEDKKISSDKALEITKNNKNINIQVINQDSKKPIVKLSK